MSGGKLETPMHKTLEDGRPIAAESPYDGTPNEEYWGIVDIDRKRKAAFEVVKNKYHSFKREE
jgi:hypothetical protein